MGLRLLQHCTKDAILKTILYPEPKLCGFHKTKVEMSSSRDKLHLILFKFKMRT
jgi:hypothetical protein